jgi:hypothetical protein
MVAATVTDQVPSTKVIPETAGSLTVNAVWDSPETWASLTSASRASGFSWVVVNQVTTTCWANWPTTARSLDWSATATAGAATGWLAWRNASRRQRADRAKSQAGQQTDGGGFGAQCRGGLVAAVGDGGQILEVFDLVDIRLGIGLRAAAQGQGRAHAAPPGASIGVMN